MNAEFPEKLQFLFEPHRYKGIYGGRGKGGSWGFARAALIQGTGRPLRILCARETQKSIADSCHALLEDQIAALDLKDWYDVQKAEIVGKRNASSFIFAGLKRNINNIKSLEAVDIAWVEEAQKVSKDSWEKLIPTIRKPGSEIWVGWNSEMETDDTHRRFVLEPPPGAKIVKLSWRDNPWFPETLRIEKDHLERTDHAAYRNVWEGECKSAIDGAIYAVELALAEAEGRIGNVPCDRTRPVEFFWDLGWGDKTAIWMAQAIAGEYRLIDYLENSQKTAEWYIIQIQQRGYLMGTHWLPWDGLKPSKHMGAGRSIEELLRAAGLKVRMVTMRDVVDGINAARTIFPQCRFDQMKCDDGLRALRTYQMGPPSANGSTKREPLHDDASHGADAFRYLATAIKQPTAPPPPKAPVQYSATRWS